MPDILDITIIMSVIAIIYIVCKTSSKFEKRAFNNGICKCCGNKLYNFDTDSQGGRGYTCRQCDHTVWVSYPSVDKKFLLHEQSILKDTTMCR